jgi:Pyruvate/2-oxoacid:ferredoxin oxidoreductase delta subunit
MKLKFFQPSTRAFLKEARNTPGFSWFDRLHGYIYMRWPYLYIGIGVGEHGLARLLGPPAKRISRLIRMWSAFMGFDQERARPSKGKSERVTFADTYHGKVVPLAEATRLVTVNKEISLTNLEHIIPYARARDIILHNPEHIAVLQCPCRTARAEPCQPLDVCLIVGEPFVGLVVEHHPERARRITPDEAAAILQAEHERGHVHHAFFKDAMLDRFYAICNCCACCCGAMQAHQNGVPMLASSGFVSHVDQAHCTGCATCTEFCQFGALAVPDGLAVVDTARCMGCGVCAAKCPQEALSLRRDPAKGEPLEIHKLMAAASRRRDC